MRRAAVERARTKSEWKKHRWQHVQTNMQLSGLLRGRIGVSAYVVDCQCDEQQGRFRKRHALGCGLSQCYMCKGHKYPKRQRTRQELRAALEDE